MSVVFRQQAVIVRDVVVIPRAAENAVSRDQPERARVRFGIQSSLFQTGRERVPANGVSLILRRARDI